MIIAVDGPSGAGKSSVCREVARRMGFRILDTGAIYRSVALLSMEAKMTALSDLLKIAKTLPLRFVPTEEGQKVYIGDRDVSAEIRSFAVTQRVNEISQIAELRAALLDLQRRLAVDGDVIVEGRDIGSVVFPEAELKIFYTASVQARAKRRLAEFEAKGEQLNYEEVLEQIRARDESEYHREASPLVQCEDAVVLDTSALNFEESCAAMQALILKAQALRRDLPR
ncbi:MAG: (d)CMP kinase [Bradymonadales bacterium]|jgi:cytidylate kinase